jgi:hypothetical protein
VKTVVTCDLRALVSEVVQGSVAKFEHSLHCKTSRVCPR